MSTRCFVPNCCASSSMGCAEGKLHGGDARNFSMCMRFAHFTSGCKWSLTALAVLGFFCLSFFGCLSPLVPDTQKSLWFKSKSRRTEELLFLSACLSRTKPAVKPVWRNRNPAKAPVLLYRSRCAISGFFEWNCYLGEEKILNRQAKFLHSQITVTHVYGVCIGPTF